MSSLARFVAPGEQIAALWRPGAIRVLSSGALAVAERGSRRLLLVHPDGRRQTLFDAEPERPGVAHFDEARWDDSFGAELVELRDGRLLLASLGGPLRCFDPSTGAVLVLQGTAVAAEGMRLGEVDMRGLAGLERWPDSDDLVLLLDHRLWRASMQDAEAIDEARLSALAGNGESSEGPRWVDALATPLALPHWSGLAIDQSGGVLFQEKNRFRYWREGRVLTVTGDGSKMDAKRLDLADFSGRLLPSRGVARWHQGRFYVLTGSGLLSVRELQLDRIELDTGVVEGSIMSAVPYGLSELGGFDFEGQKLLLSYSWAGSILVLDQDDSDFSSRIGPLQGTLRYRILDEEHQPYRLDALMLPQALVSLSNGSVVLAHQPLISLLSSLSREQPELAKPFYAMPTAGNLGFGPMASDNRYDVIVASGFNLEWIELSPVGEGRFRRYSRFFRPWQNEGVPGPALDARISDQLAPGLVDDGLLLLSRSSDEILSLQHSQGWLEVENGARFGRSLPSTPDDFSSLFSLDLSGAKGFSAQGMWRAVVLPNPFGAGELLFAAHTAEDEQAIAGVLLPPRKYRVVLGGGSQTLASATNPLDLAIRRIEAFRLGVDEQGLRVHALVEDSEGQRRFLSFGSTGELEPEQPCDQVPVRADQIALLQSTQNADEQLLVVRMGGLLTLCSRAMAPRWLGGRQVPPQQWVAWDSSGPLAAIAAPPDGHTLAWLSSEGGVLGLERWSESATSPTQLSLDLPEGSEAYGLVMSTAELFVIARGPRGSTVWGGAWAASALLPRLPMLRQLAGGGDGRSKAAPLAERNFGVQPASMALRSNADVYLAMSDSRTVWHLVAGENEELDDSDMTHLLWEGAPVFDDDDGLYPMAVSPSGRVVIAGKEQLYALMAGRALNLAGGGREQPSAQIPSSEWQLGEIRGLAFLDETLYVLSARGLYGLGAFGELAVLSDQGYLELSDGRRLSLDYRTTRQPVLAAGRDAELLLVHPASHELVAVPTSLPLR